MFRTGRVTVAALCTVVVAASLLNGLAAATGPAGDPQPAYDDPTGRLDPAAFARPPSTSRPHAFWFWNGAMTEAEIGRQLDTMRAKGVEEFFIHPRQGLGGGYNQTEYEYYLTTDYFDKVGFTLAGAKARGMKAWLYDDVNWPSGYAGGRVVGGGTVDGRQVPANPEYRAWHVQPVPVDVAGGTTYDAALPFTSADDELVAALAVPKAEPGTCATDGQARGVRLDGGSTVELTDRVRNGRLRWDAPAGDWCLLQLIKRPTGYSPAYAEDDELPYVDMLNPAATRKFLDITHETYWKRFAPYFGSTVQGIFNDEPGFYNNTPSKWAGEESYGSIPWTGGFRGLLRDRLGYDVTRDLASLWYDTGATTTKTRVDYWDVVSDRLNEAHTKPLSEWAARHRIALISNPLVEEDLGSHLLFNGGSWFEMSRDYQLPGMDLIGGLNTAAITPKLNSSVAHVFGRARNLSETFGAFGWDLTMDEMRRTVGYEIAGGVDLVNNHAFYYSIDGERSFESQPSEFFQNTFWPRFQHYTDLVGRLTEPVRGARPVNPVAVLYLTSTLVAEGTPYSNRGYAGNGPGLGEVNASWVGTSNLLLQSQLDFDYLDELALAGDEDLGVDLGAQHGRLSLRDQQWQALVMPRTTVLSLEALGTIERLVAGGGTVVAVEALPTKEAQGRDDELRRRLAVLFGTGPAAPTASSRTNEAGGFAAFLPDRTDLSAVLRDHIDAPVAVSPATPDLRVRHVRRAGDDAVLVVNLSDRSLRREVSVASTRVPEIWDPETGETRVAPVYRRDGDRTVVRLDLEPFDTTYVMFRPGAHNPATTAHATASNAVVEDVRIDEASATARVVADEPGAVYVAANGRGRTYSAVAEVTDQLQPLALDGDWAFRFDAAGTTPVTRPLSSWTDLDPAYSGSGTYSKSFTVPAGFLDDHRRIRLDLGQVRDLATVSVNGGAARSVDWRPYVLDVTDQLRVGANTVSVTVTNTPTNAIEDKAAASGLLGPVALRPQRVVDLELGAGQDLSFTEVSVAPERSLVPPGRATRLTASIDGIAPGDLSGTVLATPPTGWTAQPAEQPYRVPSGGVPAATTVDLEVTPPAGTPPGSYQVAVVARPDGGRQATATATVEVAPALLAWEFDTDGDTQGWAAANQLTPPEVGGGTYRTTSTGGDPWLLGPGTDLDLSRGLTVQVVMDTSVGSAGQLFWTTPTGGLSEIRSVRFEVQPGRHAYEVTIPPQADRLTRLRLDPLRSAGDISIEAIRVFPG